MKMFLQEMSHKMGWGVAVFMETQIDC